MPESIRFFFPFLFDILQSRRERIEIIIPQALSLERHLKHRRARHHRTRRLGRHGSRSVMTQLPAVKTSILKRRGRLQRRSSSTAKLLLLQVRNRTPRHTLRFAPPAKILPRMNRRPHIPGVHIRSFAAESEGRGRSLLDLPELALDNILEKLQPEGLCTMSGVCASLKERCRSDHLWERHMKQKWGRVIGPAAYREWQCHIATRKDTGSLKKKGFLLCLPDNSIMSCYLALETGKFWFPAQVYNRRNGDVGFLLSCYDAELSYNPRTDTFDARYPLHGRRPVPIENGVPWERLRAPPIDASPHDLYNSDCLDDLRPGDHIEIQWRKNKEYPNGWWYGVVGHLEPCDGNGLYCQCHNSESVVLEFQQYGLGSQWRRTIISRKDHQEAGGDTDGFYGGIRKLYNKEEIEGWRQFWPAESLV